MKKPLTHLFKPRSINDVIGQSHLIGPNKIISKMIEKKTMFSLIFFGLPGIGKTSLAQAICHDLNIECYFFNPTVNKKFELDQILQKSKEHQPIAIIIDEIHRMNKDKQDLLLKYLEDNQIYIIGTTTENPFFTINPAIRSRCQVFELKPISQDEMKSSIKKIAQEHNINIDEQKIELIANNSLGDLRTAINTLELFHLLYRDNNISFEEFSKVLPNCKVVGSSYGNEFYDLQSAFHKSLRGSDPDAAIYYLARLIKIGDLQSIARRMIAMAYEDIGLANPNLLSRVILAVQSAERLGFPEANHILATTVIEMCLSPKSNSGYLAISQALSDLDKKGTGGLDIPIHLKDAHYSSATKLGRTGYKYPHDYKNNWVEQEYLPNQIKNIQYYVAGKNEIEKKMNKILEDRKK